jgi:hypothetical protein
MHFPTCESPGNVPDGFVEHALEIALSEGRAFQILLSLDFPADLKSFFVLYRSGTHLPHALLGGFIVAKIELGANEDDGYSGRVVLNLGRPLIDRISAFVRTEASSRVFIPWP